MSTTDAYTDVVEICALLQCLGFSVKSLDSSDANMSQDGPARTVVINCQTSGLHVVLESANMSCSCPAQTQQNSGMWQVSGMAGGKQLEKEFGCSLLGSLPKSHRERLTKELHEMIRAIKQQNESDMEKPLNEGNKFASLSDLKTPEKLLLNIKAETPTRYRSLDTLTASKESEQQIPTPGPLRVQLVSECDVGACKKKMCTRQGTYTLPSTPGGSVRRENKTSSPINARPQNLLESLIAAEQTAADLCNKLTLVIGELMDSKDESSMSSLVLDVSKISVSNAADTSKAQFASTPNLSGLSAHDELTKTRLKRYESVSSSNLVPKLALKEGKMSRLRRITPNIFKKKEDSAKIDKGIVKPKIITPVRIPRSIPTGEPSPNPSTSSRKKFSHVKSTIPRPAKKE